MTVVRVKGFQIFRDKKPPHRWRCYHRKTKIAVDLEKCPIGSAEFLTECARIVATMAVMPDAKPGTLGLLIKDYRASPAFQDLKPRTQNDYQRCLDYLKPIDGTPLSKFDSPLVVGIRDKASAKHGRRFGNYVKAMLSIIFSYAAERGGMATNPATNVKNLKRKKGAQEANRPWSDDERDAVMAVLPKHMAPAVALMMYCGIDPQDALLLPRSAIRDGMIDSRRGKTSEPIWLPLPDPVQEAIDAAGPHDAMTVCANSRGRVWTVSGFRASWRPIKLGLEEQGKVRPGLTLKGLRHTVATILAEMGFDNRSIADLLGQKTEAMAAHYSRRADRTKKNTATIRSFTAEVNRRRTEAVKPK